MGPATVGESGVRLFSTAQAATRTDSAAAPRTFRVFIRSPSRTYAQKDGNKGAAGASLVSAGRERRFSSCRSVREGWGPGRGSGEIGRKRGESLRSALGSVKIEH